MVVYEKADPLVKRAPTITDTTEKILRFDTDNLYPQKAEQLIRDSPTLGAVYNRLADFVNGEGFQDPAIANLIVNKKGLKGQSLNKVLRIVSHPFVRYQTIPLHIGYNLLGQISSINPVKYERVRFGLRDKNTKKITHLAYSTNWEKDGRSDNDQAIVFYPTFNPDPAVVLQQITACGGMHKYKGQIMYLTPEEGEYSLACFEGVWSDAQVQHEIGLFKVGNTKNSFLATLAILYPGEFGSPQEAQNFNDLIANKSGARNAGGRIGMQDKTGQRKASDMFVPLTPPNLDKLFEYTETSVKENIMESEAFPAILLGKSPNGLFAQGDMEEAYTYVNAITRSRRSDLSEVFALLLNFWETPIVTDAKIKEQRYIVEDETNAPGNLPINDNLKNMTGAQNITFNRILRQYGNKKINRAVAEVQLRQGFGLSDDEIKKLLDGVDAAIVEEGATTPVALMLQKEFGLSKDDILELQTSNESNVIINFFKKLF